MVAQHTPGPWQHGTENEGYFIANGELRPDIAKAIQSEADANLIAAAPDLLEALEAMVKCSQSLDLHTCANASQKASSAIAKATGEQA